MDQAAEAVVAVDLAAGWRRRWFRGLRGLEVERAMRSLRVVVLDVDAQHALEVAAVEDQQPVEALAADSSDETLGDGVAFGARTGVLTIRMPAVRNASSKGPL